MDGLLIFFGILALLGGGAGYFVSDGQLSDENFVWFGKESEIRQMIDMRNISKYAIMIGILLIVVGVVLFALHAIKRNAATATNYAGTVAPADQINATAGNEWTSNQPQQTAVRVCKNCGKPLASAGTFCPYCGADNTPPAKRRCSCGCTLEDDAVFCPNCGRRCGT